ncbi:MAG: hypothetical protein LBI98_01835 [Endomicrobium sp.]|jgi:hypothetical protein|nr:hypothetical protein [Endomicrobium sp.]
MIARVGWCVGFTKIFFSIFAGFLATFVISKYSYRESLSLYLIFVITALFIVIVGFFVMKLVNFLCMNFLDKIGGLMLNVCIWLVLYVIVIVPNVMICEDHVFGGSGGKIYKTVSCFVKPRIPLLKDYVFPCVHLKSKL